MKNPIQPVDHVISIDRLRFKIIPDLPQHDVIYSVAAGTDGKIYMGVCSEFGGSVHAHFASYDPQTDRYRDIQDLEALLPEGKDRLRPPHAKIHTSMSAHPDGRIIWLSHTTPPIQGEKIHRIYEIFGDPERGYLGSCVFSYDPRTDRVENLGRICRHAGARTMALNPELDEVYTVTYPTAHFIVFRLRSGEVKDLGRIAQNDAIGPCWSADGCVYTTNDDSYMIRYDPRRERLERLAVRIPFPAWHSGWRNRVRRARTGPDGVKIYGLTGLSCRLYEYDPTRGAEGTLRDVGLLMGEERFEAPNHVPHGKSLAFGRDGRAYIGLNVGGGEFPQVHLMAIDPHSGEAEDFGRLEMPGMLPLHTVQDACSGPDGSIYLGGAMGEAPTFLAAFNPQRLPATVVPDPEAELAPHRLPAGERSRQDGELRQKFIHLRRYWLTHGAPFVVEGQVMMHDLGLDGYLPLIPDGESAISALAAGPGRRVYGATSGRRAHLFVQWRGLRSVRTLDFPVDLGVLEAPEAAHTACRALAFGPDGCLYAGTITATGGRLFRHDPRREEAEVAEEFSFYTPPFDLSPGVQIEDLGAALTGQGILALVGEPRSGLLYGLGTGGALFAYAPETGEVHRLADLQGPGLSQALFCDAAGNVYGSMGEGALFCWQAQQGRLETLPVGLPCGQGRSYLNALSACTWGADGRLYAGTSADGMLFSLEIDPEGEAQPAAVRLTALGCPGGSGMIRALAAAPDGRIFGVAGREDLFSRLFVYDPRLHSLRDLGIVQTSTPRPWVGQRFDAMAAGPDGEMLLGEADRISHLFVYFPPLLAR